jgi:hypothetical protein
MIGHLIPHGSSHVFRAHFTKRTIFPLQLQKPPLGRSTGSMARFSDNTGKNINMKRFLILSLLLTCLFNKAQMGQTFQPAITVMFQNPMTPLIILEHFARTNPDAIPFWGTEGNNYTVRYIDPRTALGHKLVYDRQGVILRSENEIALNECPASLVAYYHKNHANEPVRIWSYEENTGLKKYFIRVQSRTLWFDKEGRYMKRKILWN